MKPNFEIRNILAMASFRFFWSWKKCFLLPFSYLLIDLHKLWTVCLKKLHLVKNSLFIPNLCKCSTNHIFLYPLMCYFLPKILIFSFEVWVHIKTNILSYYALKSLCKPKSFIFYFFFGKFTLKIHCQLIFTWILFFSFSKASILYREYEIKMEIQYL